MKSYLTFLFLSIFKKISVWIVFFVYLLSIISFVYIIPVVLNYTLQKTFSYISIIILIVIIIATCSSYITATIFRSGIDDGSELLVLSKQISRLSILLSKVIVLLTFEIITSMFCSILVIFTKFFKYGISNPTPFVIGVFLMYFIVSMFFSSLTILFSLKLKKSGLTLISSSIAIVLSILTFINYIVGKTPGINNTIDSYSVSQNSLFKKNNSQEFELYDGYNLYYNYFPVTSTTTNYDGELIINNDNKNNIINYIYWQNLNKTKFLATSKIDIAFQWTQLLNLSNFIFDKNTVEITCSSVSSLFNSQVMSNYYLEFKQIPIDNNDYLFFNWQNNLNNINFLPIVTREKFGIYKENNNTTKFFYLNPIDNNFYNLKSQYVYIPIIDEFKKVKFVKFNNPYLNKSDEIINFLTNKLNIIYEYKKFKNWINNHYNDINYYFNQFLLSYFFNSFIILLENIQNGNDILIVDKDDKLIQNINNNTIKNIFINNYHIDLDFIKLLPIDYLKSSNFLTFNTITIFTLQILESIQYSIIEYLTNINSQYGFINNNENNSIISSGIFKDNSYTNNSTLFFAINENLINKLDLNIFDYLQESSIYINEIPVSSSNIDNFSTFAIAKYNTYLNLYGTIFGWLGICIIFITISTYFYYRKDFK